MGTQTKVSLNMFMKAVETDMQDEMVANTFFGPLTTPAATENDYAEETPAGVVLKKTKVLKEGHSYIECGQVLQINNEGVFGDEQLLGNETVLENYEARVYFEAVRNGAVFRLKGRQAWIDGAFKKILEAKPRLTTWHQRFKETAMWQAFFRKNPDFVADKIGSECKQLWHPHIFGAEANGLSKVTHSITDATMTTNLSTMLNSLAAGDCVDLDIIDEAEQLCQELNIPKIKMKVDGQDKDLWLWAYPTKSRQRIRKALRDLVKYADVRGPGNRAFGGIGVYGNFLFSEANYIPRLVRTDANTVGLQEAWAPNSTTRIREDQRASNYLAHGIFGANAMWEAEPEKLSWDEENTDYKAKKGVGTYHLFGASRAETHDNEQTPTKVLNQGGIVIVEHLTQS